jgi:hypothetical protein
LLTKPNGLRIADHLRVLRLSRERQMPSWTLTSWIGRLSPRALFLERSAVYAASMDEPSFYPRNGKERVGVHSNRARKSLHYRSHCPDVLAGEHAEAAGVHLEFDDYRQAVERQSCLLEWPRTEQVCYGVPKVVPNISSCLATSGSRSAARC